ncbi:MAG: radical SAM protein [Oligoflexia bacterium]|nr:radical SAM protein [Oligoflexia bacterium]
MFNFSTKLKFLRAAITKKNPIYAQIAIESHCNLRCRMCGQANSNSNYNNSYRASSNLSLEQIDRIAFNLQKTGLPLIVLTGGEPFLRSDLDEIIKIFNKHKIATRIQTNATLITKDKVEKLLALGLTEYSVSLDTLDAKKQDYINGMEGSWEKAIRGIATLSEVLPTTTNFSLINTVVSNYNLLELPTISKFVTAIGFFHSLIPVHFEIKSQQQRENIFRSSSSSNLIISATDWEIIDDIYSQLLQMKKSGHHIHNSKIFLQQSKEFLKYGKPSNSSSTSSSKFTKNKFKNKCDSPNLYFHINSRGHMTPCLDLISDISVLDPQFISKYMSGEINKKLKQLTSNCSGCIYPCYAEISYFCHSFSAFIERGFGEIKYKRYKRKSLTFDQILDMSKKYSLSSSSSSSSSSSFESSKKHNNFGHQDV